MPLAISILAIYGFLGAAHAQELKGNAAEGKKIAAQLCAECHDVSGNEVPRNPPGNAPAFITFARSPDHTARNLRRYLNLPHGRMVNILVTGREANDVVSYIESLRHP